jgi:hypothetical protein
MTESRGANKLANQDFRYRKDLFIDLEYIVAAAPSFAVHKYLSHALCSQAIAVRNSVSDRRL